MIVPTLISLTSFYAERGAQHPNSGQNIQNIAALSIFSGMRLCTDRIGKMCEGLAGPLTL